MPQRATCTERNGIHTALVLGGTGFFGERICRALARDANLRLLIGGRDGVRARELAITLGLEGAQGLAIDARDPALATVLAGLRVDTVVHTAGPFQGQDYVVARAAIHAGAHYMDLSDGREFVAGIGTLDSAARERGVLVTSGASSLPALSAAVVDRYRERFQRIDAIRVGIGSGARAPGLATLRGVFSYCGKPFLRLEDGEWRSTRGWQDLRYYAFPRPVGRRFLGSCDVPDLALFPQRYPGVRTVTFHAGFAGAAGHLFVWAASFLVRAGLLPSLVPLAAPLHRLSRWLEPVTSARGAMFVAIEGRGTDGRPLQATWHLLAARNHGPFIPCGAAIALVRSLAAGATLPRGAMPCMGLLSVGQILAALEGYDVTEVPA